MFNKIFTSTIYILLTFILSLELSAQTRTVGLFLNDTALTFKGYTLLAPNKYTSTYLIDNEGRLCHKWSNSTYSPANSVYLLPNGNLLRTCKLPGSIGGGGDGGRLEMYNWGDTLIWQFTYSTQNYVTHHDVTYLPNGNILMIACEKKTISQALAAGFDSSKFQNDIKTNGYMLPDYIIEVQPTYPSGGNIVWQWHIWDHLIQDFDSTKLNYGVVANQPELVDCDGDGQKIKSLWNHMNSINYNSRFDQIILSVRGNSEIMVIDHSTTTDEAAGHTGGRYGHGGDILYRWGNPICYKLGTSANQKLFQQHDAEWIDTLCPGYGNMTVFNNGVVRNYSSADQFAPPVDSLGFYYRAPGTAFGPTGLTWTYSPIPTFYCANISGAQRLPNGNTLITEGPVGTFIEVTFSGQIVWKYINPVINSGPLYYNDSIPSDLNNTGTYANYVFKTHRYSATYPGLVGKDLTPGALIELYPTGIVVENNNLPNSFELSQNYPNPFNPSTEIEYQIIKDSFVSLKVFDVLGKEIATLVNEYQSPGSYSITFDAAKVLGGKALSAGLYLYRITSGDHSITKKMLLVK